MLDVADLRKNHLDTYAYFFTKVITKPKNHPYHLKPAGTYAVAYLMGNYYDSKATYIDTSVLPLPLHRVSSALPLHFS